MRQQGEGEGALVDADTTVGADEESAAVVEPGKGALLDPAVAAKAEPVFRSSTGFRPGYQNRRGLRRNSGSIPSHGPSGTFHGSPSSTPSEIDDGCRRTSLPAKRSFIELEPLRHSDADQLAGPPLRAIAFQPTPSEADSGCCSILSSPELNA